MQRCMTYLPDMQEIESDILPRVNEARDAYCAEDYTADDVKALSGERKLCFRIRIAVNDAGIFYGVVLIFDDVSVFVFCSFEHRNACALNKPTLTA